jgi:hypothetical protein
MLAIIAPQAPMGLGAGGRLIPRLLNLFEIRTPSFDSDLLERRPSFRRRLHVWIEFGVHALLKAPERMVLTSEKQVYANRGPFTCGNGFHH